jgi:3-oxoadipate CoA-transferase beta subunit
MMELFTKNGESKLVPQCTYPITGLACVTRVYTDLAIFELRNAAAVVVEMVDGLTMAELQRRTGLSLRS